VLNPVQESIRTEAAPPVGPAIDPYDLLPVPYVELDCDGNIVRVNARACAVFGLPREEFVGRSGWDFLAGDELMCSQEEYRRALESPESPSPVRRAIRSVGGDFRTYDVFRSVVRDGEDKARGMRHVAVDVTEAVIAHEEAVQARAWLESVLHSLGEAVLITDSLGFVRSANPAAEELLGWQQTELIGKAVEKFMPILSYQSVDGLPLNHRAMLEQRLRGIAVILDRRRYQVRVELTTAPIVDSEHGYTAGVVHILRRDTGV